MKTLNRINAIRNTLKHLALAVAMAAGLTMPVNAAPLPPPGGVPNLALWLDASQLTGLSDGGPVATWTDMSGLGNHATAAGTPIYKTGVLNGKPVIRFNSNSSFATANLSSLFPTTFKNP